MKREQPRKDNSSKRVNFDNESKKKFNKEYVKREYGPKRAKPEMSKTRHSDESGKVRDTRRSSNEIAWYAKNPELVKAAGSLPFASILGSPISVGNDLASFRVPGHMQFWYEPAIGGISNDFNAVTQCFDSMYSFIVHANSRNYNYNSSDLGILCLAGIEVFGAIAHAVRAYGLAKRYVEQNQYYPSVILGALGFDPVDIRANLANMWFDLNDLIVQTRQIWVPNTLPLLARRVWMNSNIFADAPGMRAQTYAFAPSVIMKYDATSDPVGGMLRQVFSGKRGFAAISGSLTTPDNSSQIQCLKWATWKKRIQECIDALVKDEDRGIIFGDILNAYGPEKIYAFPTIDVNYMIEPVYNPEVLTQIENLTINESTHIWAIRQTPEHKIYPTYYPFDATGTTYSIGNSKFPAPLKTVLNFHQESNPTPEQVMIATRLQSAGVTMVKGNAANGYVRSYASTNVPTETTSFGGVPTVAGTEVIVYAAIYDSMERTTVTTEPYTGYLYKSFTYVVDSASVPNWILTIDAFDWHPFLYQTLDPEVPTTTIDVSEPYGKYFHAFGDYDNYTTINLDVLRKLHDVALYSLFGVPQM